MKKIAMNLNNEDGYFLILATLMILVLLTILGVAASRTANTEITVAANEMVYQRNFYMAEGALMEAIDGLERLTERAIRDVVAQTDWAEQRRCWRDCLHSLHSAPNSSASRGFRQFQSVAGVPRFNFPA